MVQKKIIQSSRPMIGGTNGATVSVRGRDKVSDGGQDKGSLEDRLARARQRFDPGVVTGDGVFSTDGQPPKDPVRESIEKPTTKKKRGRPSKKTQSDSKDAKQPKRGRGRPKKVKSKSEAKRLKTQGVPAEVEEKINEEEGSAVWGKEINDKSKKPSVDEMQDRKVRHTETMYKTFEIVSKALKDAGYKVSGGGKSMTLFSEPAVKVFIREMAGVNTLPMIVIRGTD